MIKLESIYFSYEDKFIFQNFSLKFEKGKFYALLGKNGSGKSTLIKLILGVEKINEGNIFINEVDIKDNIFQCRKNIGVVFQNPDEQLVTDIVEEEIAFSMENYGYSPNLMEEKIDELLEEIKFQKERDEKISKLSGGEKQRLCIASALALDPKVLILDEGTSMLDPMNRKIILKLLKRINEKGVTIILVTHHLDELEFCDEVIYLEKNEVKFKGHKQLFNSFLVRNDLTPGICLTPMLKVARSIYMRNGIDVSQDVFDLQKMGEHLWNSL